MVSNLPIAPFEASSIILCNTNTPCCDAGTVGRLRLFLESHCIAGGFPLQNSMLYLVPVAYPPWEMQVLHFVVCVQHWLSQQDCCRWIEQVSLHIVGLFGSRACWHTSVSAWRSPCSCECVHGQVILCLY